LSVLLSTLGQTSEAIYTLEESLERLRAIDRRDPDADLLGRGLINLGVLYGQDWTAVRRCYDEALETFTSVGNDHGRSQALMALAEVDRHDGLMATARARVDEALEVALRLGDRSGIAEATQFLGDLHRPDDLDRAIALHREAIAMHREVGSPRSIAFSLTRAAFVDVQRGDAVSAARHFGEAEALYEASGMTPFEEAEMDDDLEWMKATLGEESFAREWEAGRNLASPRPS
jgi:tetratricopeptide (TPR) repeat protein